MIPVRQAAKRRGEQESSAETAPGTTPQPPSPRPGRVLAAQPSSPTSEISVPSLSTPAASTITSPSSPAAPIGRATMMATLRERNKQSREAAPHLSVEGAPALASAVPPFRGTMPPGPEGRARLLETLRVKSRQQQQQAPADRARAIARVMAERSASSGVSAPSSSPPASTTSPSAGESLAVDTSLPVPPSHEERGLVDEEERGVTQMTGGLEWLKMGEKADAPPVVMKGSAGTTVKLGTNYIRLELAQDKGMWEYEVKFSPSVDSKDERHKLLQQHRSAPLYLNLFLGRYLLFMLFPPS